MFIQRRKCECVINVEMTLCSMSAILFSIHFFRSEVPKKASLSSSCPGCQCKQNILFAAMFSLIMLLLFYVRSNWSLEKRQKDRCKNMFIFHVDKRYRTRFLSCLYTFAFYSKISTITLACKVSDCSIAPNFKYFKLNTRLSYWKHFYIVSDLSAVS